VVLLKAYIRDIHRYGCLEKPELSIVIVNFNGGKLFTQQIRELIGKLNVPSEIIIVDNASKDDSISLALSVVKDAIIKYCKTFFFSVSIIKLRKNLGPCFAYDLGVLAAKSNIIVLMNNDVIPANIDFSKLVVLYKKLKNFRIGGLTIKVLRLEDRNTIDTAGTLVDVLLFSQEYGQGAPSSRPEFNRAYYVNSIPLVFSLMGRDVFLKSGMLDPKYFAGYEDLDLSLRIQLLGYKLLYVPYFTVYHKRGSTSGREEFRPFMSYFFARAHVYNLLTYYNIFSALIKIFIRFLLIVAYSLISRNPFTIWFSFIKPFIHVMLNTRHFIWRRKWYKSLLVNKRAMFRNFYKGVLPLVLVIKKYNDITSKSIAKQK